MTNDINGVSDIIRIITDVASDNPKVAAGMAAAGVLIGIGKWLNARRKKRKAGK